jgi:outer membrane receptor protein involved in Fe transport
MKRSEYPLLAALLLSLPTAHVTAQSVQHDRLEEVIVTANYRESTLMNAVGSISVVGRETISERAAQHLEEVLNAVPNVTWASASSRSRFIQVRGVGDLEQYYDPKYYPSVGMMLDDLELGDSANAGMLFDVEQVEVLRGPQGTRFGASAHAGMVKIRSSAPTDVFEGHLSGGVGNYDSYNLGLVLSGPLKEDLKGRIAMQQYQSDGYIDNERLDKDETNDFDELTLRSQLQWTPGDTSNYALSAFYFDSNNGLDAWSLDNDRDTQSDQPGEDSQETLGLTARGDWFLSSELALEAVVSYIDADLGNSYDADWISDEFCQQYLCSFGNDTSQEVFDRDRERWVADLRLLGGDSSAGTGSSQYALGLYANSASEDFDYQYFSVLYGDFASNSEYDTDRYAVYGEYEYAASGRLTLVAGMRYERFEDDYGDSNGFSTDGSDDLWNAELSARYDWTDDTMVYVTLARGAKPGGINTTASANQPFMSPVFQDFTQGKLTFDDETLHNAEMGVKTRQFDQRLSLTASVFYMDRDDAQLENWMWDNGAGLWISYLDTTSGADSYGMEVEATLRASERIEVFANLGLLETEVDTIETFDLDVFDFVTKSNRDQAKSPDYQYNAGARVLLTDRLSMRVEIEGQDDSYFGYYHDGRIDSYDLFNASLRWQNTQFNVTLWGRNLTDEDYAVHGLYFGNDPRDNFGAFANETYYQWGEPRTYGVDVSYTF